jgi:hypothetical protein
MLEAAVNEARKQRRLPVAAATLVAVVAAAAVCLPAPASAASGYTAGGGPWNVRYCATTQCDIVGQMPNGPIPDLICQVYGQRVSLGDFVSSIWDRVRTADGVTGYMTDAAVFETPGGATFDPRLPRCGGDHGGSVYFKPRDWWPFDPDARADYVVRKDGWSFGDCTTIYGGNYPDVIGNRRVTTLAGWSLGRLGPTYIMQYNFARVAASIDQIILYDPGSYDEYFGDGSCDTHFDQSRVYADWLSVNPNNRLVILAGKVTRDVYHPDAQGHYYQGIQQALFPRLTGTPLGAQVLVCDYHDLDHPEVLSNFDEVVRWGPWTICPQVPGVTFYGQWHP